MYLATDGILETLVERDTIIPVIAIILGCGIAMIAIIFGSLKSMAVSRHREETKRELAAYVAEGTMQPDQAVAMINAGRARWESCGDESKNA